MRQLSRITPLVAVLAVLFALPVRAGEGGWTDLTSDAKALEGWQKVDRKWQQAGSVALDEKDPKRLTAKAGKGVLTNAAGRRALDLVTKEKFGDVEVHVEFLIPKKSNSGVKLMGLYEIQILDSHGVKKPTGADCGGIYPRAEEKPRYHHIDDGVPPKVNVCKPAGEWQTLDIVFKAPRFDPSGKKTANARFVKVVMNGKVIHEDVEVKYPTGAAWRLKKEVAQGPLLLQGDHGSVAFRNVRIRPYVEKGKAR
jgi:hypothetical protein